MLNTIEKYEIAKHNKSREYVLLKVYSRAVKKGDIHVLTRQYVVASHL